MVAMVKRMMIHRHPPQLRQDDFLLLSMPVLLEFGFADSDQIRLTRLQRPLLIGDTERRPLDQARTIVKR